jgi:transcriptional regulator with XRE-family HTH domain
VTNVKAAFAMKAIEVPVGKLLGSRGLKPNVKTTTRYKMIAASVAEVGIIEPLVVYPQRGKDGTYVVLDGHVRLEILRDMQREKVTCIVSTDDENCTYNHRISRLAPIQENKMILKAIDAGVPEERIAKALNVTPRTIRESKTKLVDIAPEAIELLKDKPVTDKALRYLKKVKPFRQIEMAELMNMSRSYAAPYAKTLLATTPADQLVGKPKVDDKPDDLAKLEVEMRAIEQEFVVLEESYSTNTLNLQLARGYLKTLLANARVAKYLGQKHAELLGQLRRVVEATSLDA